LGAILIKARVLAKRRRKKFESDRQDLIALLSFVDDPRDLAATDGLKASEKKWLADVAKALNFDDPSLGELFGQEQLVEARQAFEIFLS
jgi:hypothetical protein